MVASYTVSGFEEFLSELRRIEAKWQERWFKEGVFEADPDRSRPKYFITVPYPYTSGPLHIGHGRTYTLGDVYARYKRMRGFNVLFPMAFHITGTPIASISSRIARGDEEAISLYRSYVSLYIKDPAKVEEIVSSFKDPMRVAMFFANVITEDFKSLGYSIDWRRRFTTGDPEYNAFITWQYHKLMERGLLVRGRHPVLYCPSDGNAVGEDDIRGGDEFRAEIVEFTAVKFDMGGKYLVAATLRPETLFGATNVWVRPDADYVEALVDGEAWIVSAEAAEKLKYQDHEVKVLRRFKGAELLGARCVEPLTGRELPVLPALFVEPDSATGVVYSVPAHAPYDYAALMDLKEGRLISLEDYGLSKELVDSIEPISIISIEGYSEWPARDVVERLGVRDQLDRDKLDEATSIVYRDEYYHGVMKGSCGPLSGMRVSEAKEEVKRILMEKGRAAVFYETSPHPIYCRCGAKVIVAVLRDQWFLNYADPKWKELAWKALNSMVIYPEKYRKLFEATFDWLALRPCARRRGLGTRLPFDPEWIIESLSDSTIYMAFYTIAHLIRRYEIAPDKLTLEFFDYVFLGIGDPKEVSRRTGVNSEVLRRMREEFTYWYPVDHRHTAIGHITNHLSFFIFHHAAIFPEEHWPRKITLNEYVIREGAKMSKSRGNVLPLVEIPRKYSADLYRLYITSAADLPTVVDWREAEVLSVLRRLRAFWRIANEIASRRPTRRPESLSLQSRWIVSRINSVVKKCTELIESYRFRDYVQEAFFRMLSDVERYRAMSDEVPEEERAWAEWYVLERWVRLLAPVIPHAAEEIWERIGGEGYVSLATWPEPEEELIDVDVERCVEVVEKAIEDAKNIIRVLKEPPARVYMYVGGEEWQYEVLRALSGMEGVDMREAISRIMAEPRYRRLGGKVVNLVRAVYEGKVPLRVPPRSLEVEGFMKLSKYMSRQLGVEVVVYDSRSPGYDPKGRARLATAGRPAIYVEV